VVWPSLLDPKLPSLQPLSQACLILTLPKVHIQVRHLPPEGLPSAAPMQQGLCTEVHLHSDRTLSVGPVWHPPDMQKEQQVLAPHRCPGQEKLELHWLVLKAPRPQKIQKG
jgi:hypothetical protein